MAIRHQRPLRPAEHAASSGGSRPPAHASPWVRKHRGTRSRPGQQQSQPPGGEWKEARGFSPGCPLLRRPPAYSAFPAGSPNSHSHDSSISRVRGAPLLAQSPFQAGHHSWLAPSLHPPVLDLIRMCAALPDSGGQAVVGESTSLTADRLATVCGRDLSPSISKPRHPRPRCPGATPVGLCVSPSLSLLTGFLP